VDTPYRYGAASFAFLMVAAFHVLFAVSYLSASSPLPPDASFYRLPVLGAVQLLFAGGYICLCVFLQHRPREPFDLTVAD
jgi:hypothetical protein